MSKKFSQRITERPVVVDYRCLKLVFIGKRRKTDGQLDTMDKLLANWPNRIYVINREFKLVSHGEISEGIEEATYRPIG